jgi:hypothetical protein
LKLNKHGENYYISKYQDDEGNNVHETDLLHIDLTDPDLDLADTDEDFDNVFMGSLDHIRIYTIPKWYFETNKLQQLVRLEGATGTRPKLPTPNDWQELASKYPIGKVLKVKEDYYEVIGITVDIVTGEFIDVEAERGLSANWTDTDLYTAVVEVKPYGDVNWKSSYEVLVEPNIDVLKKWSTGK